MGIRGEQRGLRIFRWTDQSISICGPYISFRSQDYNHKNICCHNVHSLGIIRYVSLSQSYGFFIKRRCSHNFPPLDVMHQVKSRLIYIKYIFLNGHMIVGGLKLFFLFISHVCVMYITLEKKAKTPGGGRGTPDLILQNADVTRRLRLV